MLGILCMLTGVQHKPTCMTLADILQSVFRVGTALSLKKTTQRSTGIQQLYQVPVVLLSYVLTGIKK